MKLSVQSTGEKIITSLNIKEKVKWWLCFPCAEFFSFCKQRKHILSKVAGNVTEGEKAHAPFFIFDLWYTTTYKYDGSAWMGKNKNALYPRSRGS